MFRILSEYSIILVTGPQRSGTTICARMISHDLGHTYIDESRWGVWDGEKARQIAATESPCVLQAPGLLKDALLFDGLECAVVMMRRRVTDIIASQERVSWNNWAEKEISHYVEPGTFDIPHLWVAGVKYAYWDNVIRDKLPHWTEIEYEALKSHPMWVPKEKRKEFTSRQYK